MKDITVERGIEFIYRKRKEFEPGNFLNNDKLKQIVQMK
jgi:hypothetical protein